MRNSTKASAADDASPLRALGRYECDEKLGGDGVVETYRARVNGLAGFERAFALKCLRARKGPDQTGLSVTFLEAARLGAAVGDARIVPIVEANTAEGAAFVVTEYVHGFDLGRLRVRARDAGLVGRRGAGEVDWLSLVSYIGIEMARGLCTAHATLPPSVHGGLSPGNVIATVRGEIKLLDFGLRAALRAVDRRPRRVSPSMAPEVMSGLKATPASDMYAVGAILFELAVGTPPPPARGLGGPPRTALATLPAPLAELVGKLLSPQAAGRPSAAELAGSLPAVFGGTPEAMLSSELGALVRRFTAPTGGARAMAESAIVPTRLAAITAEKPSRSTEEEEEATIDVRGAEPRSEAPSDALEMAPSPFAPATDIGPGASGSFAQMGDGPTRTTDLVGLAEAAELALNEAIAAAQPAEEIEAPALEPPGDVFLSEWKESHEEPTLNLQLSAEGMPVLLAPLIEETSAARPLPQPPPDELAGLWTPAESADPWSPSEAPASEADNGAIEVVAPARKSSSPPTLEVPAFRPEALFAASEEPTSAGVAWPAAAEHEQVTTAGPPAAEEPTADGSAQALSVQDLEPISEAEAPPAHSVMAGVTEDELEAIFPAGMKAQSPRPEPGAASMEEIVAASAQRLPPSSSEEIVAVSTELPAAASGEPRPALSAGLIAASSSDDLVAVSAELMPAPSSEDLVAASAEVAAATRPGTADEGEAPASPTPGSAFARIPLRQVMAPRPVAPQAEPPAVAAEGPDDAAATAHDDAAAVFPYEEMTEVRSRRGRVLLIAGVAVGAAVLAAAGAHLLSTDPAPAAGEIARAPAPMAAPAAVASDPPQPPAAPRPPRPAGPVSVSITSRPEGAAIWVGGRERGRTPATIPIGPDVAQVRLVRAGFQTTTVDLDVATQTSLSRDLAPTTAPPYGSAVLRVSCRTRGRFPVLVDGAEIGLLCPTEKIGLPPGQHTIALLDPATGQTQSQTVTVKPGSNRISFKR